MKKIFILSILIAPIMANADNVGPAAASGTPVVATANAPFATAGAEIGDTTNVVSASFVKGAYNDAIAAVNKVNASKQNKLVSDEGGDLSSRVFSPASTVGMFTDVLGMNAVGAVQDKNAMLESLDNTLMSTAGVLAGVETYVGAQRVVAVTTWGNDSVRVGVPFSDIARIQ